MGRKPCCDKMGMKRGPWTIEEDHKLMNFILNNGILCWRVVPMLAGLARCGKSCRLRWMNYLRPDLKRGAFTESEEDQIIQLHARLGNRWSKIASYFSGRTDNEMKNYWNTKIKKKLMILGIDPLTHKPIEQEETNKHDHDQVDNSTSLSDLGQPKIIETTNSCKENQLGFISEEALDHLLSNDDIICHDLDMDLPSSQEFPDPTRNQNSKTSSSSSLSAEDSTYPCLKWESTAMQGDCSMQQWVVDEVDSVLSWNGFSHLQDDFLFMGDIHIL